MIASRQIAFGGGKRKPYDAEVEYLELSGKEWIILPYLPVEYSRQLKTTIDYQLTMINDVQQCSGSLSSYFVHCSKYGMVGTNGGAADLNRHTIVLNGYGLPRVTFDGVELNESSFVKSNNADASRPFTVGNIKPGGISYPCFMKLYAVKVENNIGDSLNDLIPVRVGDVGYMYDKVSGQLFGNVGTGAFVLGSDI